MEEGMTMRLTEGAIEKMKNGATADSFKPVLQVTDLRLISSSQNTQERYRVVISDGTQGQQGMLGTQKNDLVKSNTLQIGSIVQLTQYTFNVIQGRSIIIIIELNVILDKCDPIGEMKQNVINPMATPAQVPSITHSGLVPSNSPSNAGNSYSGGSLGGSSEPGRFNVSKSNPMYPTLETGTGNMGNNMRTPMNNYGRQPQPSYQQPPPMYMNRGPISKNEAPPRIIPIAALNPYQGRWTIKARVTSKSELRRFNNARGDGKVFSFDLLDSDGGEIRSTCFNAVADQFYNLIEVGKIYLISKGSLKPAQKAFNHLRNEHEIMLESMSTVQPCLEDDKSIPAQQFHFRPIADVESLANNDVVDLIGVVSYVSPSSSIMKKNGEETQKRTLHLKDMSGRSVELTMWGNFCNSEGLEVQNMCDSGVFPVLAVKAGRVSDFNGKSVGTLSSSQLIIDPDFPEAYKLKQWFEKEGKNVPPISLSRETGGGKNDVSKTISQIKDEKLGTSEKPDWITVKASISFMRADNFCYTACPVMIGDRQCNKKVTNNGDGKWRCDRCDQTLDTCDYRYMLQFQIQDHTGLTWVTAFQESGVDIMGVSAKDLYFLKYEEQNDEKFAEITHQVLFNKYSFKLKVKEETFNDEQRVKSTVVKAEKVNYSSECKLLLQLMNKPLDGSGSAVPDYLSNISTNNGNQHSGSTVTPSGSARTYMNVSCNLCGGTGHSSANCPTLSSFGSGITSNSGGGSTECYKCHQYGHWARDCPGSENVSSHDGGNIVGDGGGASECYKCHQTGHWARECPGSNNVSSYGGGNIGGGGGGGGGGGSTECYKCHQFGHWARDCPGLGNATSAYGSGGSRQRVGGF